MSTDVLAVAQWTIEALEEAATRMLKQVEDADDKASREQLVAMQRRALNQLRVRILLWVVNGAI